MRLLWGLTVFLLTIVFHTLVEANENIMNQDVNNQKFSIVCTDEEGANMSNCTDDTGRLLSAFLDKLYPYLPSHLKEIAINVSFVWNKHSRLTNKYMGWSAEDDTGFYKYPDTNLYHINDSPKGTIRVNFTNKFLDILELGRYLDKNEMWSTFDVDGQLAREGWRDFINAIIIHELTHAYQFTQEPVMTISEALSLDMPVMRDGIVEDKFLKETFLKVENERDAMQAERKAYEPDSLRAFAELIINMENNRPEFFNAYIGKFRLLTNKPENHKIMQRLNKNSNVGNPFAEYYLIWSANGKNLGRTFSQAEEKVYVGQYQPCKIVKAVSEILSESEIKINSKKLLELQKQWKYYMEDDDSDITGEYPYLLDVKKRYEKDMKKLEKRLNISKN